MITDPPAEQWLAALLHLSSPALPLGAFSYSQGLEAAVEAKDVTDEATAKCWIEDGLRHGFGRCELPLFALQYHAWSRGAAGDAARRDAWFRASRETSEMLAETEQMGWAAVRLVRDLRDGMNGPALTMRPIALPTAMAFLAWAQGIPAAMALVGYASCGWRIRRPRRVRPCRSVKARCSASCTACAGRPLIRHDARSA